MKDYNIIITGSKTARVTASSEDEAVRLCEEYMLEHGDLNNWEVEVWGDVKFDNIDIELEEAK